VARDVNSNEKGFYCNISCRRKTRENMAPLLNRAGSLVKKDVENPEVLSALLLSSFTGTTPSDIPGS